jgi:hypothetical protein
MWKYQKDTYRPHYINVLAISLQIELVIMIWNLTQRFVRYDQIGLIGVGFQQKESEYCSKWQEVVLKDHQAIAIVKTKS